MHINHINYHVLNVVKLIVCKVFICHVLIITCVSPKKYINYVEAYNILHSFFFVYIINITYCD